MKIFLFVIVQVGEKEEKKKRKRRKKTSLVKGGKTTYAVTLETLVGAFYFLYSVVRDLVRGGGAGGEGMNAMPLLFYRSN